MQKFSKKQDLPKDHGPIIPPFARPHGVGGALLAVGRPEALPFGVAFPGVLGMVDGIQKAEQGRRQALFYSMQRKGSRNDDTPRNLGLRDDGMADGAASGWG